MHKQYVNMQQLFKHIRREKYSSRVYGDLKLVALLDVLVQLIYT
jgi:hypothetical protein